MITYLVDRLLHDPAYIDALPQRIVDAHPDSQYDVRNLKAQIDSKRRVIAGIQSYLMANIPEISPTEDAVAELVGDIVRNTLAFSLGNEEQQQLLVSTFLFLAHHLIDTVPTVEKRRAFSKTLLGIEECQEIESWLDEAEPSLNEADDDALQQVLWPLLKRYVNNASFRMCDSEDSLRSALELWMEGTPFDMIADQFENARIGTRVPRIQHIVDICENGFSFDGSLIVGAVAQLLEHRRGEQVQQVVGRLLAFQKRLKYGLRLQSEIALYELGFADRPLVTQLARLLDGQMEPSQAGASQALAAHKAAVRDVLDTYPSYFTAQLDALV